MDNNYEPADGRDMKLFVNGQVIPEFRCFRFYTKEQSGSFIFIVFDRNPSDLFTEVFDFTIKFAAEGFHYDITGEGQFEGVNWSFSTDDIVSEIEVVFKILSCSLNK